MRVCQFTIGLCVVLASIPVLAGDAARDGAMAARSVSPGPTMQSDTQIASPSDSAALDSALAWLVEQVRRDAPRLRSAGFALQAAQGALSEASGRFDPTLRAIGTLDVARGELLPFTLRQQRQSRFLLEELDASFGATADRLAAQLAATEGPVAIDCDGTIIVINGREICDTPEAARDREALYDLLTALMGSAPDEESLAALAGIRDQAQAGNREAVEQTIIQLRRVSESSRLSRLRLGDIPRTERRTTLTADIGYDFPLRNGWIITPQLLLEGIDDTFEGKPRSPNFGGKGNTQVYRSALGATLVMPLGRGGAAAVGSDEDVARMQLEASRLQADSTAQVVLRDVLSGYVRLLAAAARMQLAERRLSRMGSLAATVGALIETDQLAGELQPQVDALLAQARADGAIARRLQVDAERDLANLLGAGHAALPTLPVRPEWLATLAALPVCDGSVARWQDAALRARPDLEAARWRERAAERLTIAARDLLRPQADLSVTLAWSGRDERQDVLFGFTNSIIDGVVGPSVLLNFSWDLAWRNDGARGRVVSALALAEQAAVALRDGERSVLRSLHALAETLHSGGEVLALQRQAAQKYGEAHSNLTELVQMAEADLLSLVTSDEQLEAAAAARIDAEEAQARRLIDLRLSLGALRLPTHRADLHWLAAGSCLDSAASTARDAHVESTGVHAPLYFHAETAAAVQPVFPFH